MRFVYRIVVDCDPPPSEDYLQMHGDELDDALEDAVADFYMAAGAGFSIDVIAAVEW